VTDNLQGIPLARDIALRIRDKIKAETGLNASAGISYNKFLAKLASDHRKPNGQYVITPEMGPAFVEALPVGKFHGIGPATSAKMNSLGLYTGLDMRNQTLEFMQTNFGKAGAYYYWISRGVDNREVRPNRIRRPTRSVFTDPASSFYVGFYWTVAGTRSRSVPLDRGLFFGVWAKVGSKTKALPRPHPPIDCSVASGCYGPSKATGVAYHAVHLDGCISRPACNPSPRKRL
jgi:hypothetical protein